MLLIDATRLPTPQMDSRLCCVFFQIHFQIYCATLEVHTLALTASHSFMGVLRSLNSPGNYGSSALMVFSTLKFHLSCPCTDVSSNSW